MSIMKRTTSKLFALAMALCMCFAMSANAFAAEIVESGGSGTTPVTLSTSDGSGTAMSVILPTSFPVAMSENGDVTTATDCKIINNSYGAVRVASVNINAENGWKLTAFGDKTTLAGEKVDSNKFGFALSIGSGEMLKTDSSDKESQCLLAAPTDGCYIFGIGNEGKNIAPVHYDAIVTPLSGAVVNTTIANVVFVIEWDTAARS